MAREGRGALAAAAEFQRLAEKCCMQLPPPLRLLANRDDDDDDESGIFFLNRHVITAGWLFSGRFKRTEVIN